MDRLALAAELIIGHDYELAIEMLKKEQSSTGLYWLSLLYRLFDKYAEEKEVVEAGLKSTLESDLVEYFSARQYWQDLDINKKMVPRQSLHMPRSPLKIPDPEDIRKMCFVTGGDSNYFPLFVEAIESIRATNSYKNCDVFVFDCGLTEEQKRHLLEDLQVKAVSDPGWDVNVPMTCQLNEQGAITQYQTPIGFKCMVARPHMDKHFPGYRYYMWIDADAWIQDERAVDLYLDYAKSQGIGLSHHITFDTYDDHNCYFVPPVLTPENKIFLKGKPAVIVSAFCIDIESGIFDQWRENFYDNIKQQGFWWNTEEQTLGLTFHQRKLKHLVEHQNHAALVREGLPIVYDNDNVLHSARSNQVLGTIHMSSGKWYHYFPSQKRTHPIRTNEEYQHHVQQYGWGSLREICFKHKIAPNQLDVPNRHLISCRFRVWPWEDKPEIKETLIQEAKRVLVKGDVCHV